MPVRNSYSGSAVSGEVLTAANVNRLPGGWIGYSERLSDQNGITTEVDLTGLSATVTVGSTRRIRVSVETNLASSAANDIVALNIKEGATVLQTRLAHLNSTAAGTGSVSASVVLTPTTGSHTYKASMLRASGTGTVNTSASGTSPAFILVEDLGPAT